jgi:hypothetical protein
MVVLSVLSALPLLVLRVLADHAHDAAAAHELALGTDPADRRSDFHVRLLAAPYFNR